MDNLINIEEKDGQLLVSSLEVAKNFDKKHYHVMEAIEELLKGYPEKSGNLFYKTTYIHEQNKQEYSMYLMNRDGFSLLTMGFNGKKALEWKFKYINAFNEMEQKLNDPMYMVQRSLEYLNARCSELMLENNVQKQQIAELQPKASYYDVVLNCKELINISVIAKDYGWSATKLNKYLNEKGVQYKQDDVWLLYQPYAKSGYTSTNTYKTKDKDGTEHAHVHTKWTQKGRLFIYDLLKNDGIIPLIEREG